ncbi:UNVERIFIED_CONTAM: hypothetical protein NCL1_39244 [Trichonephila clavipes]
MTTVLQSHCCRTLLNSFHSIFHLMKTSLRTPDSNIIVILVTEHIDKSNKRQKIQTNRNSNFLPDKSEELGHSFISQIGSYIQKERSPNNSTNVQFLCFID